jgi:mevalonate kinase
MHSKSYNAKILLFGEYTIINGSHALAIPISQFKGKWAFGKDNETKTLRADLDGFVDYLDELNRKGDLLNGLDLQKFRQQLDEGLYFDSDIPHGYGAGSSGALCAAVYERFSKKEKAEQESVDSPNLRKKLAQLESFFHGSSSGIDPLISFFNKPIFIESDKNSIVQLPRPKSSKGAVFLLDTGIERKTEPLVRLFLEKCNDENFAKICEEQLANYNEKAIQYFLAARWRDFFKTIQQISQLQLEHFNEMIPQDFISVWKKGLEQDLFKLKLCGAGGGGFILGFTEDFEQTTLAIPNEKLIPIFRF